jgi:hypothetical protein
MGQFVSLLCRTVERPDNETVRGCIDGVSSQGERPNNPEGVSGLLQALLGQAAELPQPRLDKRKEALSLVNMDALWRNVPLFVYDCSMVKIHPSVRLESVCPDLSQLLGEVFSLPNHWLKIAFVVDTELAADHAKRVAARRDERQLITVTPSPA